MAHKAFEVPQVGMVYVYKRRGSKSLRLTVNSDGKIRVTQPTWLPFTAGLTFAQQKHQWLAQQTQAQQRLQDGQRLGKYHTLRIRQNPTGKRLTTRISDTNAVVSYPPGTTSASIDHAAHAIAKRAMRAEAEQLLPQRLQSLARQFNFSYQGVTIRHLKSRWGSCSAAHIITLNYYLMQLPWTLIDYVLVHELAHTKELNHSRQFWQIVTSCLPDYKNRRRQMKDFQPSVLAPKSTRSMP